MTSTYSRELKAVLQAASEATDLPAALRQAAEAACKLFGLPKIYFARAMGRRLHYLGGYGEETYLPAQRESLGHDLFAFLEGAQNMEEEKRRALLRALHAVVEACPLPGEPGSPG